MSKKVLLLGGNGFVGRALAVKLSRVHQDYTLVVSSRKQHCHPDLMVLPAVTHQTVAQYNATTLVSLLQGVDIVINCVGILHESSKNSFRKAHAGLMRDLIEAVNQVKLPRLIHISSLNADANAGKSRYLRSKGEGENYLHTYINSHTHVTTYRPSLLYGRRDTSITLWARLMQLAPVFYPIVAGNARLSPIYIDDFISLILSHFEAPVSYGKGIDVLGPDDLSIHDIHKALEACLKQHRSLRRIGLSLPEFGSYIFALLCELLPTTLLSVDNLRSLRAQPDRSKEHIALQTKLNDVLPYILAFEHRQVGYNHLRRTS